jgi:hypothetical protein
MTNVLKIKKKLKKKIRAFEKKIKNIKITESPEKKRKLDFRSGGNGRGGGKGGEKDCFCPSKFAAIKRDLRSIIEDKRDFYNIFFIRLNLFER